MWLAYQRTLTHQEDEEIGVILTGDVETSMRTPAPRLPPSVRRLQDEVVSPCDVM